MNPDLANLLGALRDQPDDETAYLALADWCLGHGIEAADVWAFGDMPNDLPMLSWAGRSYAVANAHPEVVAVATDRCASNDDDGVATVLAEALQTDVPPR